MTLDRWLEVVTAGLPPAVVQRIRSEYTAHLYDSGQPETDALAALGDPKRVRRALAWTYLSEVRLRHLRSPDDMSERIILGGILGLAVLGGGLHVNIMLRFHALQDGAPFMWWTIMAPPLTVLFLGLTWALTRPLTPERRRYWRQTGYVWCLMFANLIDQTVDLWTAKDTAPPWLVPLGGLALLIIMLGMILEDRCLRRTLQLEGGRV